LDDPQVRAQLERLRAGHGRAHPPGARLVIAGSNHPTTLRRTTYGQRPTTQDRIVAHLDGSVKTVAVNVNDLAHSASCKTPQARHGAAWRKLSVSLAAAKPLNKIAFFTRTG